MSSLELTAVVEPPIERAIGETITVRSCKFDGSLHRSWKACLVSETDELVVLDGVFERDVRHEWLGLIERGTRSLEYFWTKRWYSLYRFFDTEGAVRIQYVNINLPPTLNGSELSFIDLDLDLLLHADGTHSILDEDEFQTNAQLYAYPAELCAGVRNTLNALVFEIKAGRFPSELINYVD
ncbi:MAG: DUF402 domain-containing protein [Pyrinomonadaceae bacterium]